MSHDYIEPTSLYIILSHSLVEFLQHKQDTNRQLCAEKYLTTDKTSTDTMHNTPKYRQSMCAITLLRVQSHKAVQLAKKISNE